MTDEIERRLAAAPPTSAELDLGGLRDRLAGRAAGEGLLDVAYATADSPLGPLTVVVTPRGLVRLSYPGEPLEMQLDELAARISPRILHAPRPTDEVRRQLEAYFEGRRHAFDVPIDWRLVGGVGPGEGRPTAQKPIGAGWS